MSDGVGIGCIFSHSPNELGGAQTKGKVERAVGEERETWERVAETFIDVSNPWRFWLIDYIPAISKFCCRVRYCRLNRSKRVCNEAEHLFHSQPRTRALLRVTAHSQFYAKHKTET